ncbi:MAG: hypothetical protein AB7H80_13350, partial [Candidatus Kapaibacterium sp.]
MISRLSLAIFLIVLSLPSFTIAQNRDFQAERVVVDDNANDGNRNTMTIQAPNPLLQNVVLTIPDPGAAAAEFLIGPPGNGGVWFLNGNTGTTAGTNFLGTTDNQPFEIHLFETSSSSTTGTRRVARFEPVDSVGAGPNIIFGYSGNLVSTGVFGGVIGGGGSNGSVNQVTANFGTVAGGYGNSAGLTGTIGGGSNNLIDASSESVVGGGNTNTIIEASNQSTIAGGNGNDIMGGSAIGTIG